MCHLFFVETKICQALCTALPPTCRWMTAPPRFDSTAALSFHRFALSRTSPWAFDVPHRFPIISFAFPFDRKTQTHICTHTQKKKRSFLSYFRFDFALSAKKENTYASSSSRCVHCSFFLVFFFFCCFTFSQNKRPFYDVLTTTLKKKKKNQMPN